MKSKSISKKELCEKMGISSSTLGNLLNKTWYNRLKEVGYNKSQQVLSIKQVFIIKEIWGDYDENS